MRYNALTFGIPNINGVAPSVGSVAVNSFTRIYGTAFKLPADDIIAEAYLLGKSSGTITLGSTHKLFITEGIGGKLYHIATVSAAADTLTLVTNHNVAVDDRIVIFGTTMPTGITRGDVYYVVNVATNAIKISATQGGTAIDLTDTGTSVCVAKVVDYGILNAHDSYGDSNGTQNMQFVSFEMNTLSSEKIYHLLYLNCETDPTTNYFTLYTLNGFNGQSLNQYTTNLTTLTRSYNDNYLQYTLACNNRNIFRTLGYNSGNGYTDITSTSIKCGNSYVTSSNVDLNLRKVVINAQNYIAGTNPKDTSYVCTVYKGTILVATSIPLKPFNFTTTGTANQTLVFDFADVVTLYGDTEYRIMIEGYNNVDSSNHLRVNYMPFDYNFFYGVDPLFSNELGTEINLLWYGISYLYSGGTWQPQELADYKYYFFELHFDNTNPFISHDEPSSIF